MQFQWKREWTTPSVVGVVAFGVGTGVGYVFATYRKRIERKLRDSIDEMGSDIAHLQNRVEESGVRILEASWDIIRKVHEEHEEPKISDLVGSFEPEVDIRLETPEGVTSNVWLGDAIDHNWDMDAESASRVGKEIYILHREEYDDEEKGYSHTTLTYYAGDDILTDENDVPIHNPSHVIGEGNLIFSKGSGDPHIVYIRNDRLEAEMEVILDTGFYQVEVLGQDIEDRLNAEKPVLPKFRDD